jgi:hypothetical protein
VSETRSALLAAFGRLVDALTRRVDHLALYPCRVVAQRADGTLDLQAEDPRVGSPASIPYRTLRGLSVEVAAGARVLLGFEGGNPARPVALLWELGDATVVRVNGGDVKVARDGDDVSASAAMATWMTAVNARLAGSPTPPPSPPSTLGTIAEGSSVLKVPGG